MSDSEEITKESMARLLEQIPRLRFSITINGCQGEVYKPIEGVDHDYWPVIDVVPFYRAHLEIGEDSALRRIMLEGPSSHDQESFNKLLDRIFIEIRIEVLKQFERLEKPHDRMDAWKDRSKIETRP
jgi:hypothetical protein